MKLYRAVIESNEDKQTAIDRILKVKTCKIIELSVNEIVVYDPPLSNYVNVYWSRFTRKWKDSEFIESLGHTLYSLYTVMYEYIILCLSIPILIIQLLLAPFDILSYKILPVKIITNEEYNYDGLPNHSDMFGRKDK